MSNTTPLWKRRQLWTIVMGLAALAFWVVGIGAGARGWILSADSGGIVSHAQGFGTAAYVWWIPASVLTLTTVVMAIGLSIVRHLVDGPVEVSPERRTVPEKKPLTPKQPKPPQEAKDASETK